MYRPPSILKILGGFFMFDSKYSYNLGAPLKKTSSPYEGESKSVIYKVKTTKRIPYFIKVNYYENDVHFIKFYHKKFEQSPNKYKMRIGNVNEMTRLVSTCIKLAVQIHDGNRNAIFGVVGQWDEVDVKKQSEISQRYRIYIKAILSVLTKSEKSFDYFTIEKLNTFLFIPSHMNSEEKIKKIGENFSNIMGSGIQDLAIPNTRPT